MSAFVKNFAETAIKTAKGAVTDALSSAPSSAQPTDNTDKTVPQNNGKPAQQKPITPQEKKNIALQKICAILNDPIIKKQIQDNFVKIINNKLDTQFTRTIQTNVENILVKEFSGIFDKNLPFITYLYILHILKNGFDNGKEQWVSAETIENINGIFNKKNDAVLLNQNAINNIYILIVKDLNINPQKHGLFTLPKGGAGPTTPPAKVTAETPPQECYNILSSKLETVGINQTELGEIVNKVVKESVKGIARNKNSKTIILNKIYEILNNLSKTIIEEQTVKNAKYGKRIFSKIIDYTDYSDNPIKTVIMKSIRESNNFIELTQNIINNINNFIISEKNSDIRAKSVGGKKQKRQTRKRKNNGKTGRRKTPNKLRNNFFL